MAEIIYSKNGEMKCAAKSVRYTGSFMGVPQLEVEIDGPVPLGFEVGDYIVFSYDGIRYSIIDLPQVQKQSSFGSVGNAFVYENVVFKSPLGLLSSIDFLDTVLSDNNIHYSTLPVFSFFGDIKDFADRLQANLNRIYSSGWKVTVEGYDDSSNANYDILHDYKEISLSNQNCLDALSIPYETWKITYVFMLDSNGNNCIVFNHALDAASAKSYGKGNGLYSLTKRMSAEKPVITRLRAYGSTDNLPARYYNNLDGIDDGIYLPNLMIPRSKWKNQNDPITAYIDSTDIDENDISMSRYGVREKSIYFDGSNDTEKIEPTIKGVTAGMIRAAKEEMGDTSNVPYATLYPDDERMDKIVEAESIADKGVESDGEVYMDSIEFNVSKGEDRTVVGTKNGLDPIIEDLETSMEISTPATYKVVSGNPTPFCRFNTGVGIVVDSAILNVYTVDEDGVKTLCDSVKIYSEFISGVNPGGGRYAYRDFYFAGSNGKDSPLYIKVPYKGVLLFQYNIDAGGADSVSLTMSAVSLTASTGPIILQNKFWVRIKQIGFDINSYPSTGEAKLVVNSGGCAGRSFNIVKNSTQFDEAAGTWKFECFRSQDESLNQLFPNSIYKISEDDEFVLTGLEMPDLYVQMASQKLYDEAVKWLWKHKDGLEVFELDIDNKVAYLDSVKIKEGMLLPLYDGNLNVGSEVENEEGETVITYDHRIIDSVTIEIGEEPVPVITAVLREEKEERIFKLLNKKVSEITARTTQNAVRMQVVKITEEVIRTTASTSASTPSAVINTSDFVTLSTDQTITGEKTFANDVIFGAAREDGTYSRLLIPSSSGPGIYDLFISTQPVSGEAPTGSGGIDETELWTILGNTGTQQIGAGHLTDALAPYATQSWVQQRGYLTSVGVSDIGGLGEGWASLLGSAPDFYSKSQVYSKSEADSRFVTLATEQTISGKKSFTALLTASAGISSTDADLSGYVSASKLYVPFSGNNKKYSLLISTSPVGGETPTGSGGLDETELWSILTDGAGGERIAKAHLPSDAVYQSALSSYALKTDIPSLDGYATQEWVKGKGYLTSVFLSTISDLHADWDALLKAAPSDYVTRWPSFSEVTSTPTTLAGYGITDAYTKEQVNSELAKYVTLATEQVVSGAKTFTSALTKFNAVSGTDADFSGYVSASRLYVPHSGNNRKYFISVVTAPVDGETPSDGSGLDEEAMWTALGGSMSNRVIDIEHIPTIPTSKITGLDNALASYATRTWVQQNFLTSVPAATSSVLGGIKVGYTEISGDKYYAVRVNSSNQAYVHVPWVNTTYSLSSFGITATAAEINKLDGIGTLLHSGNIGSYALTPSNYTSTLDSRYVKKAGDTMTGPLVITSSSDDILVFNDTASEKYFRIKAKANGTDWGVLVLDGRSSIPNLYLGVTTSDYKVWHSGNDGSGSGLDADLLDGQHGSYYAIITGIGNADFNTVTRSGIYRLSYTTSNGASNGPSGNEWGNMLVLRGGGDTIAQLAFGYTSSDRPMYRQGNPSNVGGSGSWTQWYTLATTLDNVYSATKLQISRTLWGRPFDGMSNVSGDMTGVGRIIASGPIRTYSINIECDDTGALGNYAGEINRVGFTNPLYLQHRGGNLYICANGGNVGIGSSSPAYKLDVAGEIRATSGITIGSTDDYGWYISTGTRISAGIGVTRGVNVGSLLVSSAWADYSKVPTNGIYSKGDIWTGGKLFIPSSSGNNVFDAYIA